MRIKHSLILIFIMCFCFIFTGCFNKKQTTVTEDTPKKETEESLKISYPLTLKVGYSTNSADPRGVALEKFKEQVEKASDGNIIIEIHPDAELGSDGELIAKMITKEVDITVSSAGNYALYATRMGVSALPFLFEDFEPAWKFIDSSVMTDISKELEDYNMHVLSYFDNGFRCVTTSKSAGPVEKAEDMEGLNIRTPDNQIVMETMSELGANPKSFPFAELAKALLDHTFDAQENPIPVIYNNELYKVQSYLTVTNHSYDAMPLTIRNDIWAALDESYKKIISEAAYDAQQLNRKIVQKQTKEYVSKLEKKGMKVIYPDLSPFKKKTTGVIDVFSDVYGSELVDLVRELY
jgi:tripartite ATP-independent transporter DctP family solute receptor